jgi:hypothetical protein
MKEKSKPYQNRHPAYEQMLPDWRMIRDVLGGSRAVKTAGKTYLPALHEQKPEDYDRYRARAIFFNMTRRTLEALTGLALRKTPEIGTTGLPEGFQGDVNMRGAAINEFIQGVTEETIAFKRCGILADWAGDENRAYLAFYRTEDIVNWETQRIAGRQRLTLVVLRESNSLVDPETLEHTAVETYLTYRLRDNRVECVQTIVDHDGNETESTLEISRKGKALTEIPFVFIGEGLDGQQPPPPPFADMAAINISHYQTSADLENGRHVAGLPTPYAVGFGDGEFVLGTNHAWVSDNPEAKCGFLEFTGSGLTSLKDALAEKSEQISILGARMLEPEKRAAETFQTTQLKANAEHSALTTVAEKVSAAISTAMQWAAWWHGTRESPGDHSEDCFLTLSTDFLAAKIDAPTLTAMMAAVQGNLMSFETFFYNLEQGEVYPDGWTIEDELAKMEEKPPGLVPPAPAPGKPAPKAAPEK